MGPDLTHGQALLSYGGALGALRKLSLGWALLAAAGGDRALRLAAVGRAREPFLSSRLWALVIGKFVFEVNGAVAALAGSSEIRLRAFLVFDVVSGLFWAGTWVGIGYVLQASMTTVTATAASVGVWMTVEIAAVLLVYGAVTCGTRRGSTRAETSP